MSGNEIAARLQRAMVAHQGGDLAEAERHYRAVLKKAPEQFEALHYYGVLKASQGQVAQAEKLIRAALKVNPRSGPALSNYGNTLRALDRIDEARQAYLQALAVEPGDPLTWNNLGNVQRVLGRIPEAIESYRRAIAINPRFMEAYDNLIYSRYALGDWEGVIGEGQRVLEFAPDHLLAHSMMAQALGKLGRWDEAAAQTRQAWQLAPDDALIASSAILATSQVCDWSDRPELASKLLARCGASDNAALTYAVILASDDPALQLASARAYVRNRIAPPPVLPARPAPGRPAGARLRIGYLSSDFRLHPVAMLLARVIELHDRIAFEVHGFSAGPDDGSPQQRRILAAFDRVHDVRNSTDAALARLLQEHGIDIVIDLGGHTEHSRIAALRSHPAPVQVSYLGYPGTTGAEFIDYTLVDGVVAPKGSEGHFTEQLVTMPDCFLPTDNTLEVSDPGITRARCGLPEGAFVFCGFHGPAKLNPEVFDAWMRLLAGAPGSVVWLSGSNPWMTSNLRAEAERRGIDPARLVFAERGGRHADHLARQRLADLFLDVWPYNAHTTASEALWAGLPVLTCAGRSLASRVAASLLIAVGLPELVTQSPAEYEALALKLTREPDLLGSIRQRLAANRASAPLFNPDRYRRSLESAYLEMWRRYERGEPPAAFAVPAITGT